MTSSSDSKRRGADGNDALQDEFPCTRGEKQGALLLDDGDALGASARRKRVSDESVEQNPSGQGASAPAINFNRVDLPLAFGRGWRRLSPGLA